jgi:hypothetical protein
MLIEGLKGEPWIGLPWSVTMTEMDDEVTYG